MVKNDRTAPFQVRLPADLLAQIDATSKKTGRTRHALIVESVGATYSKDLGLYGWANPERAKLLGQVIGVLTGDIEDITGPMAGTEGRNRAAILAMVKIAANALLDGLGASDEHLTPEEKLSATMHAKEMVNQMRWAGLIEPMSPQVRAAHPVKAVVADLGKVWGVKTEKGE